jgi:hypothetical protein
MLGKLIKNLDQLIFKALLFKFADNFRFSEKYFFVKKAYLLSSNRQQRLDFGVQLPPSPVSQRQVLLDVALQYAQSQLLLQHSLVMFLLHIQSDVSLQHSDDLGDSSISQLFKLTHDTSLEEDLGVTASVKIFAQSDFLQDSSRSLGSINEASFWSNSIWSQDTVTLLELSKDDSVGETFTADTDTFQHTVTCKLVHY